MDCPETEFPFGRQLVPNTRDTGHRARSCTGSRELRECRMLSFKVDLQGGAVVEIGKSTGYSRHPTAARSERGQAR